MKSFPAKFGLTAVTAVIGLATAYAAQDNTDIERKVRELRIMDNIFEAALEEGAERGSRIRRMGPLESMYLADQGMVFRFRMVNFVPGNFMRNGFDSSSLENLESMLEQTKLSLEKVQSSFPDVEFDFDFDYDFDYDDNTEFVVRNVQRTRTRGAAPQAPQVPQVFFYYGDDRGPERDALRDMEEAMRDTQQEVRDMQRSIRELEREIRNDDDTDIASARQEIEKIETRMDEQMAKLDQQQEAYETFVADLENVRHEQQQGLVDEASSQIISTLCDYGATLRSLDNDEHVTVILEEAMEDTDQVYVFSMGEISDCRDADSLKANAISYLMEH